MLCAGSGCWALGGGIRLERLLTYVGLIWDSRWLIIEACDSWTLRSGEGVRRIRGVSNSSAVLSLSVEL